MILQAHSWEYIQGKLIKNKQINKCTSIFSVDEHLHCFPVLAVVNSASVKIEVHLFICLFLISFPWIYSQECACKIIW